MYNEHCYPNGSYFRVVTINIPPISWFPNSDLISQFSVILHCLEESANGGPVDCTSSNASDPLSCITTNIPANLNLMGKPFQHLRINYTSVVYPLTLPISSLLIYSVNYLIVLVHAVICHRIHTNIVEFRLSYFLI